MTRNDWIIVGLLIAAILFCARRRRAGAFNRIGGNGSGSSGSGAGGNGGSRDNCCHGCSYGDSTSGNPVPMSLGIGDYGQGGLPAGHEPDSLYEYQSVPHYGATAHITGQVGEYSQNEGGTDGVWP